MVNLTTLVLGGVVLVDALVAQLPALQMTQLDNGLAGGQPCQD